MKDLILSAIETKTHELGKEKLKCEKLLTRWNKEIEKAEQFLITDTHGNIMLQPEGCTVILPLPTEVVMIDENGEEYYDARIEPGASSQISSPFLLNRISLPFLSNRISCLLVDECDLFSPRLLLMRLSTLFVKSSPLMFFSLINNNILIVVNRNLNAHKIVSRGFLWLICCGFPVGCVVCLEYRA